MRRTTAKQEPARRTRNRRTIDPDVATTVSLAEAAERLGIGTSTAYALAARDEFPVRIVMIGKTKKVLKADLDEWSRGHVGEAV